MTPPAVLAFDVNETLLDVAALDPVFAEVTGDAGMRAAWFAQMLQLSFVGGLTGRYVDFTTAQHAALRMVAGRAGITVGDAGAERLVGGMRTLPAHPDVPPALERLAASGSFTLVALTNSPLPVAREQVASAGLDAFLSDVFSADQVQALKPAPEPYRFAARSLGVPLGALRLVAAHAWDVSGALAAGCNAAFVARKGIVPSPLGPQPDLIVPDLAALADALLARGE